MMIPWDLWDLQATGLENEIAACCIGTDYESGTESQRPFRGARDQSILGYFYLASEQQMDAAITRSVAAFEQWRVVPAPQRGRLVQRIGQIIAEQKEALARIITLEAGKITQESLGEVQECIDICEFALGLSRQLHGLTIVSERPRHRMMEQWHPLGPVGVITAFNFPMAVWAWNAALALVCGNSLIWKPSEKTPLCARALHYIVVQACQDCGAPTDLSAVVLGDANLGTALSADKRVPLISATGSTAMGRSVAKVVAARLGRSLLELGGNNACIVTETADLDLAIRGIVFAAVGTAGQRCTSLRRLFIHRSRVEEVVNRLTRVYPQLKIGDPNAEGVLVGPLIDEASFYRMEKSLTRALEQGGELLYGGERMYDDVPDGGVYVQPAIVRIDPDAPIVQEETFAPLLYVMCYDDIEQAIHWHNDVSQGLSSAIFTNALSEAELFISPTGSDCGIANVNIGTSGAEIGGAFGGEKDTGGGRESGSDAWKQYMRRTTNTINYGKDLPLAQGITFDC